MTTNTGGDSPSQLEYQSRGSDEPICETASGGQASDGTAAGHLKPGHAQPRKETKLMSANKI